MGRTSSPTTLTRLAGVAAAILVTSAIMIPPALAETRTITADSQRVAYSDLDLTSQAGARTLLQRIHVAAATACTTELANSPLTPRAQAQFQQCTSNAETAAVARVGAPLVASLYNTSIPKSGGELFAAR